MKRIISLCLALALLLAVVPVGAQALSQYGTVTGGWLRLRSSPSFSASTVSSYYTGTQVLITGSTGNWYSVEAPDGKTGYMYASYITFSGGGGGTAYVTSSNGLGVRMRSGPGTGYSVVGIFSVGTALTVLETGSSWSKIQIGSTVGYMMNKFITTNGGGGGGGYSATVWSDNGYGVRLRSGPGTGYAVIGVYSVGTVVSVLSHGDTWDYISVGSRTGYMMNYYLRSTSQGTATGISVSSPVTNAMPGTAVVLTTTVTGTNLSNPAYRLAVTQNASMATVFGDTLTILNTATTGSVIQVTATSVDNSGTGEKLTAVCYITVGPGGSSSAMATGITLTASTTTAPRGATVTLYPSVSGVNLSTPAYHLSVNAAAKVTLSGTALTILDTASVGDVIQVTATSTDNGSNGVPIAAVCNITVTSATGVATGISFVNAPASAAKGSTVTLNATVTGTNLSSPACTYEVTQNAAMTSINGGALTILGTATTGAEIIVKATTKDNSSTGRPLSTTCKIIVSDTAGIVTRFSFGTTSSTVTVTSAGGGLEVKPTIEGTNLTQPLFTLSVPAAVASYVTATYNPTIDRVQISINNAIPDGTTFDVTGTTVDRGTAGTLLTATVSVTVSRTGTVQTISVAPVSATIDNGGTTAFNVRVTFTNGSYVDNPTASEYYDLAVTAGGSYGTLNTSTNILTGVGNADADKTVTVQATAKANTGITGLCTVTVKKLSSPSAPTLISAKAQDTTVVLTWAAPTNTSGETPTYDFYQSTSSDSSTKSLIPGSRLTMGSGLTVTVSELTNGTLYYFWVVAKNSYGSSDLSNRISATPNQSVPDAPTGLTLTGVGETWIQVSWTAPTYTGVKSIAQYKLYANGTAVTITDPAAASYKLTGLTKGTAYALYLTATNGVISGESAPSNIVNATPASISAATVIMTVPVAGASKQDAAAVQTATANANFTVYSLTWTGTFDSSEHFISGNSYQAQIVLEAKNGIAFSPSGVTVTVAGSTMISAGTVDKDELKNKATFTVSFTVGSKSASLSAGGQSGSGATNTVATATQTPTAQSQTTQTVQPQLSEQTLPSITTSGSGTQGSHQPQMTDSQNSEPMPVIYQIDLNAQAYYTFPSASKGYGAPSAYTASVRNTGNAETGMLNVRLSGGNESAFSLSATELGSLAPGDSASFTIAPEIGLSAGEYSVTVVVDGANVPSASFAVSFTVTAPV